MKIIITANENTIDGAFSPRFGRCAYLIIVDTETGAWKALTNPASNASGGAGPQVVQTISQQNVEAVISGRYGPNAFTALQAAGVRGFVAKGKTVREVLDQFNAGTLQEVSAATGEELHGGGRHR